MIRESYFKLWTLLILAILYIITWKDLSWLAFYMSTSRQKIITKIVAEGRFRMRNIQIPVCALPYLKHFSYFFVSISSGNQKMTDCTVFIHRLILRCDSAHLEYNFTHYRKNLWNISVQIILQMTKMRERSHLGI